MLIRGRFSGTWTTTVRNLPITCFAIYEIQAPGLVLDGQYSRYRISNWHIIEIALMSWCPTIPIVRWMALTQVYLHLLLFTRVDDCYSLLYTIIISGIVYTRMCMRDFSIYMNILMNRLSGKTAWLIYNNIDTYYSQSREIPRAHSRL